MKYCFNYNRNSEALYLLDEINIKVDPEELDIIFKYILEHPHQHINVRITDLDHIFRYNLLEEFEIFKDDYKNIKFSIALPDYDSSLAQLCQCFSLI